MREQFSFEDLLQKYEAALDKLVSWNVRIPPSSRLCQYAERLRQAIDNPNSQAPSGFLYQLMFDLREIDEIIEIASSFTKYPTHKELKKLRWLPKGGRHPDDENDSRARDIQYELYLRAVFRRSGISIDVGDDEQGEPDLIVQSYPLEAKRPKSRERLEKCLSEAVKQLNRQKLPGVIAISLDQVIRPRHRYISATTIDEVEQAVRDEFDLFRYENASKIKRLIENSNVAAIAYTLRNPAEVPSPSDTMSSFLGIDSLIHVDAFLREADPHFEIVEIFKRVLETLHSAPI